MTKNIITVLFLSFLLFPLKGISQFASDLIGKWDGERTETKNGRKLNSRGELMKEIMVFEFRDLSNVTDHTYAPKILNYRYALKDSVLCIGRGCFKILKLTTNELVLMDYNPSDPDNPLVYKHFFRRTEKL